MKGAIWEWDVKKYLKLCISYCKNNQAEWTDAALGLTNAKLQAAAA